MLLEQLSTSGGQTGGLTVTVKLQLVTWPQLLLAVQVTVVVPSGKVLPLGGVQNSEGGGLQPPEAVLVKKTTALLLLQLAVVTVMLVEQVSTSGGQTGGLTVTVKLQLVTTTPQSKAVQVTVVVPMGKKLPLGGLQETVAGPQPPLMELA